MKPWAVEPLLSGSRVREQALDCLSSESGMKTGNLHQESAVAQALERERLVGNISRRIRSELDLDAALRAAVTEAGRALGVARCFIRLERRGDRMSIGAEWHEEGLPAIGEETERLAGTNLAIRERQTITISDIASAPELDDPSLGGRETLLRLGARAVLSTPMIVFDEVIGAFTLHRAEVWPWSEVETELAEAVAQEAGLAIHLVRLLEQSDRRLERASALFQAAQVVTSDLRLDAVLERLVVEVTRLLDADAADCYLHDPKRGTLRCTAVYRLDPKLLESEFPADDGLAGEALRRGRSVATPEHPELPYTVPHPAYESFASALVAPMMWSGDRRGVLGVSTRDSTRVFGSEDAAVLEGYASLAALALRNAVSFERSERQARIQRGFYRIAAVLGEPLSLTETMDAVAQAASEALGGQFAAALMPGRASLVLAGSQALPQELARVLSEGLPDTASALAASARDARILTAGSIRDDDRFDDAWRELLLAAGCRSLFAIPVTDPATSDAALVLVFFGEERTFTDDDLELARHLAGAAEGALERSELFEAERSSRALAQQLARTGSLLATELDPAGVLDEVVQHAPALLDVEACAILVLEGDELVVRAATGDGARGALGSRARASGWLAGDVFQSRAPVAVEAVGDYEPLVGADPMLASGYRAYLGVPLTGPQGGLHGVLSVYAREPRFWREDEIDALLALAANASAALSNAELYQRVALEKERSDAILANIADAIVATDRDGKVLLWNDAAEQITGIPTSEALGRTPDDVLQRSIASEGDAPVGKRTLSIVRGGEEVWLSVTEAVMRDAAGAVAGRLLAFRDISAERLVEQMRSDFVSTVSHELRTPLTSIYGFAATLLRSELLFDDEERRTFLAYIVSEAERLTKIVDSLLSVARLDSGDLELRLTATDVRAVVLEVIESIHDAQASEHRLVIDLPPEPLTVNADRDCLAEVFRNLVDNAIKFSPTGGTVTVAGRGKENAIQLRVADEGVGISQSEQARIFTKFYRAPQGGTATNGGGPGLSLFVARGLVLAMGGRMWVSSAEGKGATFVFELPRA